MQEVWVFNGEGGRFPSAVFSSKTAAEDWISKYKLTGVLTKYPVDVSVYDWAVESRRFRIKNERETSSEFIQRFSSAAQEHIHFENGSSE